MRRQSLIWLAIVVIGACGFPRFMEEGLTPVETSKACTVDANCDDNNPCTTDLCPTETLVCQYTQQKDGPAPVAAQKAADCKSVVCTAGVASSIDDPADVINDNNTCTNDVCEGGAPKNDILTDGTACTQGTKAGKCMAGKCAISCLQNNDCDDASPCTNDQCNVAESRCVYESLDGIATPGAPQTTGDCKVRFCDNGIDKDVNDNADVNVDGNSCTEDVCTDGVPSNPPVAARALCSPAPNDDVCDGMGKCVDCVEAADCVTIIETECEKRSCVNNKCEIAYQGTTILASPTLQTANDCKKIVCNGNMGTLTVPDNADLPNDNQLCTTDTCSNGMPVFTDKAQGASCGPNQVCNSVGDCVGCTTANQCPGTDTFCQKRTCTNNVCGFMNTASGTDLPMVDQTAGDCKVRECNGAGGIRTSAQQSDVPVDGNPCTQDVCNAMGTPSNPASPVNAACNFNGGDACDGSGNCERSNGKPCVVNAECVSNICVDGVCCNATCGTVCQSCDVPGSVGTCTTVPKGQQDMGCNAATEACNTVGDCDDINGQPCSGSSACLSNFCVDGVCCESSCNAACKSCNVSGGSPGICDNLPVMSQDSAPTNLCVGSNQCDGNGNCKKVNGSNCSINNECQSTFCVDGVCCDTACAVDCKVCNLPISLGTCANVPAGMDDGMCSGASMSCNGMGMCQ